MIVYSSIYNQIYWYLCSSHVWSLFFWLTPMMLVDYYPSTEQKSNWSKFQYCKRNHFKSNSYGIWSNLASKYVILYQSGTLSCSKVRLNISNLFVYIFSSNAIPDHIVLNTITHTHSVGNYCNTDVVYFSFGCEYSVVNLIKFI